MTPGKQPAVTATPANPSVLHLDATAVKVLAHPLRSRLLSTLRLAGPGTATALAGRLGTNTGATSYHLRKLAAVGLVEETGEGRGRERPWRAATQSHGFTQRDVADDPDAEEAADWLRRFYLRSFLERYEAWLESYRTWPLAWQEEAGASDYLLRLTPARLAALAAEIDDLVARYRDPDPGDAEARQIELDVHAFPIGKAPS